MPPYDIIIPPFVIGAKCFFCGFFVEIEQTVCYIDVAIINIFLRDKMKYNDVKKLLGVMAIATTASLTACGAEPARPVENEVQTEQTQEVEEPTPTPAPITEEVTVSYEQCATESDDLVMVNGEQVDYKVKDYVAPNYFEYMAGIDHTYEVNEDEGYVADEGYVVSDNYEITDDGKVLVRDYHMQSGFIPVVKYVRVSETEVEARYIGVAPADSHMVSGITFVLEKNEEGVYKMTGLRGVFDEDITGLAVYEGTFDGWAMESQGEPVYDVDDEIKISGDLNLFPHFTDNAESKVAKEDGTCEDGQIEYIDGVPVLRVIHIKSTKTDKDGNTVETTKYALAGLDAKKDKVKGVEQDKVEKQQTEDKVPEAKPAQPAKKKEENQPGQPKPESAKKETPTATDNTNHDADPDFGYDGWDAGLIQGTDDGPGNYGAGSEDMPRFE